jgi:decaprenyl-phosphate phosphoribosyltransferase
MAEAAEIPTATVPSAPPVARRRPLPRALLVSARPKQWTKNVLVVAAPAAAGVLDQWWAVRDTLVAFAAFCLAASGTYLLNDALDVEADRLHARKRHRPVAAGEVSVPLARVVGAVLAAGGVALAVVASPRLAVVVALYLVFTTTYTMWLKHVAVLDLGMVAAGFVLRLIGGAVAVDVPISVWFIIVGSFGSLFMVAGKRHAEHLDLGAGRGEHRATLEEYSVGYLGYVRAVASGVAMVGYVLWAFEAHRGRPGVIWFELSIAPFVLAILRYALIVERGEAGAPEEVVLRDRPLQVLGVLWAALLAVGLYVV